MKISLPISPVSKYVFSGVLIILWTVLLNAISANLNVALIALLYLIPIMVITTYAGLISGVVSAIFSFFAFNYFFIKPLHTFSVHRPADLLILTVFLIVAVVLSQLVGRAQAGLATANAREREAKQLYELSDALAGLHEEAVVAEILGRQVFSLAQGEYVEVNIRGAQPVAFHAADAERPARPADLSLPVQAARGVLGEILVWRMAPAMQPGEMRLLQTFASQAALAVERARLAQSASRAKVLEESDRLKSALLSSVSHELRTPLSTIKAAASSLRGDQVQWDSSARADLIAAIDDEADHLNMLVGNLLDMSRIESGALKPKREWNIMAEIVGGVVARMRRQAEEHRIAVDVSEDLPLIPVDYVQMEQVFTNLLSNSLKYAPPETLIQIRAQAEGGVLRVEVRNQGPHIPPEHLERIFDKFYRITAADRVTGTGLGLSICKGIIEAHGGDIWAENLPDGLGFHFIIPLRTDDMPAPVMPQDSEVA